MSCIAINVAQTFVGNNIRMHWKKFGQLPASGWLSEDVSWGSGDGCEKELLPPNAPVSLGGL